ncbi:MAG: hypothetical protein AB8D78_01510 [Akkermansiaceae bacterium]
MTAAFAPPTSDPNAIRERVSVRALDIVFIGLLVRLRTVDHAKARLGFTNGSRYPSNFAAGVKKALIRAIENEREEEQQYRVEADPACEEVEQGRTAK